MSLEAEVSDELAFITAVFERYAAFMAVISGQSAIDALDFVCDEAASKVVDTDLTATSTLRVLAEFQKIRALAQQALDAAKRH